MITGCGGDEPSTPTPERRPTTSPSASPTSFGLDGCPIADPDACVLAFDVASALVTGDAEMITSLSRTADFVCDEEVDLPLPDCTPGAVLTGHPVIDSEPVIDVLDAAAYAAHNEQSARQRRSYVLRRRMVTARCASSASEPAGPTSPSAGRTISRSPPAVGADEHDRATGRLVRAEPPRRRVADRHRVPRHLRRVARRVLKIHFVSTAATRPGGADSPNSELEPAAAAVPVVAGQQVVGDGSLERGAARQPVHLDRCDRRTRSPSRRRHRASVMAYAVRNRRWNLTMLLSAGR